MSKNRRTGLELPDPNKSPLGDDVSVTRDDLVEAFSELILSASGWRKVFSADRDEESASPSVRPVDLLLVALMALVYERYYRARFPDSKQIVIAVGTDTRDTGPALADIIVRVLTAQGIRVRYLFVAATPEIMAYVGRSSDVDGFIYVSASHNPRGHNGVKFGYGDGAVVGGDDAESVRELFRQTVYDYQTPETLVDLIRSGPSVAPIYKAIESTKREAMAAYLTFIRTVVSGGNPEMLRLLKESEEAGAVIDFNGSARSVSIDREFLAELGIKTRAINDKPREIAHQIVPEGDGLLPCRLELEKAHAESADYIFGYVPDNDGDRGNLVYTDDGGSARQLQAQETFALSCVAELAWLSYTGRVTYSADGRAEQKIAVVVNGPTSMRIERIAKSFDAAVYRAEVGEANVVALARGLRQRGYIVPILGEGSNGGNITHPSTVRDPLSTVGAVRKLLLDVESSPFDIWLARRVATDESRDAGSAGFRQSISGILESLPRFVTTSAFEPRAKLQIHTTDHGALKAEYERVFKSAWQRKRSELAERFGIRSWVIINYEGTKETHGVGREFRSGAQRGGFKVLFKNESGMAIAFLWMRGSGTEPVFRIMADVEGNDESDETYLLDWHVDMIREADAASP